MSHSPLFHKTLKSFKELNIQDEKIIVGVSGGLDSMVLMALLQELRSLCKLELIICSLHHGLSESQKTQDYRDKAYKLVLQACEKNKLLFVGFRSKKQLKSEEDFRNFRHDKFQKLLKKEKANRIALAHNKNDLLETRLINLIRGSGWQGLNSMKFSQAPYLRPLLNFSRKEIKGYAKACKLRFLEDPSNKDNSYLRNWMRNKWLKDLEKKRSGTIKSLSRSLELLAEDSAFESYNSRIDSYFEDSLCYNKNDSINKKGIDRKFFLELSLENQKRVLASYMRKLQLSHYGQSHIQELLKHNKRTEKSFQVKLLKKTWLFTPNKITAK